MREKLKETIMVKAKDTQYYMFDINKMEKIFDLLLADGPIKLTKGQSIQTKKELANKKSYKWHHSWSHDIVNYIVLRKNI